MRRTRMGMGLAGAVALMVIGASSPSAHAWHGTRTVHAPQQVLAGTLWIDGRGYQITACSPVHTQIAAAFCRAGYAARCQGSRVIVQTGIRRPSVRWSAYDYHVGISYQHRSVVLTPRMLRHRVVAPKVVCEPPRRFDSLRFSRPHRVGVVRSIRARPGLRPSRYCR